MKVRIKYRMELRKPDEDIEVVYLSLYPNPSENQPETPLSGQFCFLELKEPVDGSRVRQLDLTEVENLWFRDEATLS